MDPHNESPIPAIHISSPDAQEAYIAAAKVQQKYQFGLFTVLLVVTALMYGLLAMSEPHQAIPQALTAAVAEVVQSPFDTLELEAQSAFVVDLSENKIIHAKNADVQLPLASITKVMLVLAVSDVLSPEDSITISEDSVLRGEGGGPAAGEVWSVKDLIDYTLVVSSNVGAEALAEAANDTISAQYPQAPAESATVWRMNSLAKELGLSKTYFLNASGLDISPTQPSAMGSARDATILLAYAYKTVPKTFLATNQLSLTTGPIDGPIAVFSNTNDAIPQIPGLRIGKTGFTNLAGGNLGVVFETSPHRAFVATVLGSSQEGRFNDILTITEAAKALNVR